MDKKDLFKIAKDTYDSCLLTLDAKNHDYAKDVEDALRNFKAVEFFRLCDASTGVAVRLCDKFMRICNLLHSEGQVKDEKVEDTINDMINYLIILKATIAEQKYEARKEPANVMEQHEGG